MASTTRTTTSGAGTTGLRGGRRLVAAVLTWLLMCGLVVLSGGPAQAADPDSHRPATWNMWHSPANWAGAWTLSRTQDVVALQEVPVALPAGARLLRVNGRIRTYVYDIPRVGPRYLHILVGSVATTLRIGMITTWDPGVNNLAEVANPRATRNILAVAVPDDDIVFTSAHAVASGGFDVPGLLAAVRQHAANRGIAHWALLADFNRDPGTVREHAANNGARIYNSGRATHQNTRELDYMVSDVVTQNWQGTVLPNTASDHWPVAFRGLRAGGEAQELTIHPDTPDPVVLDVAGEATGNGSHLISYHATGGANQRWRVTPTSYSTPDDEPLAHIVGTQSGKCLDVDRGQESRGGEAMNIWDCHGADGSPTPGGPRSDTQGFVLEHPDPLMPNVTMLRDNGTGFYVELRRPTEGTVVHQWLRLNPRQFSNEVFYLNPVID